MRQSREEWAEIVNGFASKWNCPHCVGTMDCKYVQILESENNCSMYYSYKGTFDIVLFVVIDAHYNVI
jgi:hypothetical protein